MSEKTITINLNDETKAFYQGANDGAKLIEGGATGSKEWHFFAGRAFGMRYGEDQTSPEAESYVAGLMSTQPWVDGEEEA